MAEKNTTSKTENTFPVDTENSPDIEKLKSVKDFIESAFLPLVAEEISRREKGQIEDDDKSRIEEILKWEQRLFNLERYDEGLEVLNKISSVEPAKYEKRKRRYLLAYYNLGVTLFKVGKGDEAIEAFKKATEIKPDYAEAYSNLGVALGKEGKGDEAIEAYKKAIEIKPDYAKAYFNLGNALDEEGRGEEAIKAYKKAIEIKPDFADAYYNLGVTLVKKGKGDEAIEAYRKGINLKPDFCSLYTNKAEIELLFLRFEDAHETINVMPTKDVSDEDNATAQLLRLIGLVGLEQESDEDVNRTLSAVEKIKMPPENWGFSELDAFLEKARGELGAESEKVRKFETIIGVFKGELPPQELKRLIA